MLGSAITAIVGPSMATIARSVPRMHAARPYDEFLDKDMLRHVCPMNGLASGGRRSDELDLIFDACDIVDGGSHRVEGVSENLKLHEHRTVPPFKHEPKSDMARAPRR